MRRRAVLEGVVERRELRLEVVLGVACHVERLLHDLDVVVTHGAGGQLYAVADDVVLIGEDLLGLLVEQRVKSALRHGEGIVGKDDLAVLVSLEHREVHDEAQFKAALVDQIKTFGDLGADLSGELGRFLGGVGDEVDHVARLGAVALDQLFPVTGL